MKKIIIMLVLLISFFVSAIPLYAFRCGNMDRYIAREGMHKYQVLADCGSPVSKEIVGVDKQGHGSYRIVEEWVYIISEYGRRQMYLLKFDGSGIVVKIDYLGEKN